MNQKTFEKFFQKPEGFIWSDDLQCYYEHQDYRFKYPLKAIGEFNLKWQGWLAYQQIMEQTEQGCAISGFVTLGNGIGGVRMSNDKAENSKLILELLERSKTK